MVTDNENSCYGNIHEHSATFSAGSKSPTPTPAVEDVNRHPLVPTGKSLKELLEQLAKLNSAVKEMSSVKLKELEDRLEKAEMFEQDYHDCSEWFRVQQEELSNAGSVRGVPDGIKEQLALHMVSTCMYCSVYNVLLCL